VSPILVRPLREQQVHDRIIRLLQAKYRRKFDVGVNLGLERLVPAGSGSSAVYPDLVLQSSKKGRKLIGVVEVETTESVNYLEAMAEWVGFGRLRAPFYLYVPTSSIDSARRMCTDMGIAVAELWAYYVLGEQIRFTLVQRSPETSKAKRTTSLTRSLATGRKKSTAGRRVRKSSGRKTAKMPTRKKPRKPVKTVAKGRTKKAVVKKKAAPATKRKKAAPATKRKKAAPATKRKKPASKQRTKGSRSARSRKNR
jgi:hypothetical protein